jgi:hypothetical protein
MTDCDYHDLPLVCGECGYEVWPIDGSWDYDHLTENRMHSVQPIHRIPDLEGIEGTAIVPCGEAG